MTVCIKTRVCTGPAHPGPTALPETEEHWYFHQTGARAGLPLARCKLCINWGRLAVGSQGLSGTIECQKMAVYAKELIDRCDGITEASRLSGVSETTFYSIFGKVQCNMQKRTAMKILTALDERRRQDRRNGQISERFKKARKHQALIEERLERDAGF